MRAGVESLKLFTKKLFSWFLKDADRTPSDHTKQDCSEAAVRR